VDMIAGSSMGAYVGSIWAYGASGAEMERLAREMEQRWAIWSLIDPVFPPRRGFLRGVAIKSRLMRTIGESHFGDLVRPMRVVATNLETLDRMVFAHGRVADAVHASIAVPGICVPVIVGEGTFADGGIVDPLPVDVLREAGVSRVIAVNTIPTPERMRLALQSRRARAREEGQRTRENSSTILPFDQHLNYFARGNILEILMRSFLGVQTRMAEAACREAVDQGVHSAPVVINILARRRDLTPQPLLLTPTALRLTHEPVADCARYDSLRRTTRHGTHPDLRPDGQPQALWDAQRL